MEQTTALIRCDDKRRLAVAAGDLFNVYADHYQKSLEPRPWWRKAKKAPPISTTIDDILAGTP